MRTLDASRCAEFSNHLLIHDLACPENQASAFANCIRDLASTAHIWDSTIYVAHPTELDELKLPPADELILGQNNTELLKRLRTEFPQSKKICFGDGVGLNFKNSYYDPHLFNRQASAPKTGIVAAIRNWLGKQNETYSPDHPLAETANDFDQHCLLLPNCFDQRISNYRLINESHFIDLFEKFGSRIASLAPESHRILREVQRHRGSIHVLLTSNFSETDRMSLRGEIDGYLDLLSKCPHVSNAHLLIKPHPRDSYAKIEMLVDAARSRYQKVHALLDSRGFYFPFESMYCTYLRPARDKPTTTTVATVSSACISLEQLFGQECVQGFGTDRVNEHFAELWAPLRHKHEKDLLKIVKKIRKNRHAANRRVA